MAKGNFFSELKRRHDTLFAAEHTLAGAACLKRAGVSPSNRLPVISYLGVNQW